MSEIKGTDNFLVITKSELSYFATATEAVHACGVNPWERAEPVSKITKLELGDELIMDSETSIFRISGKVTELNG